MKLKNFFLSCSSGSRSKRLRDDERRYENLRPLPLPLSQQQAQLNCSAEEIAGEAGLSKKPITSSTINGKSANHHHQNHHPALVSSSSNSSGSSSSATHHNTSFASSVNTSANNKGGKKSKGGSNSRQQPKSLWGGGGHNNNNNSQTTRKRNPLTGGGASSRFYVDSPSGDSTGTFEELSSSSSPEDTGVKIGDRVIWLRESPYANESGKVKWKGVINKEEIAGIEFDHTLGLGSGWYRNQQLFTCEQDRGGLVAVAGLILEDDYFFNPSILEDFSSQLTDKGSSPSPSPSSNSSASLEIGSYQGHGDNGGTVETHGRSPQEYYQGSVLPSTGNGKLNRIPHQNTNSQIARSQLLGSVKQPPFYGHYDSSDAVDARQQQQPLTRLNSNRPPSPSNTEISRATVAFRSPAKTADWDKVSGELETRLRKITPSNFGDEQPTEVLRGNSIPIPETFSFGDGDYSRKIPTGESNSQQTRFKAGSEIMPTLPFVQAPLKEEDVERINGRAKGIQGHRNSCYLDATLFSMFSFTGVFDSILLQDYNWHNKDGGDEQLARQVQRILRDEIVTPLRKNMYCTANNVMKLRETMQHLDDKLTAEEMDPQEFLQLLFSKVLHLEEFMSLSSGQSDFFHQVLVQQTEDDKSKIPTIQQLFEQSLIMQDLKLKSTPTPALILQMPRSGNKYKMYDGILPNLTIDITDLMENTPRTCIICGGLATYECPHCYGKFDSGGGTRDSSVPQGGSGAESTAFCETCLRQSHMRKRQSHANNFVKIKYHFDTSYYFPDPNTTSNGLMNSRNNGHGGHPFGAADLYPSHHNPTQISNFNPNSNGSSALSGGPFNGHSRNLTQHPVIPFHAYSSSTIPRVSMDLFAVICIETSHFVSFVKCGTDRKAPWVFFDSMADRVENPNGTGHNVPQVKMLPKMGVWLEQLEKDPNAVKKSWDNMTPELRRLLSDPYICLYYSPQSSMYS